MTTETFAVTDAQQLAVVERGGFIESRHAGSAVVLAPDGQATRTIGDPRAAVLPRSALKPLYAVGAVLAGAELGATELALAAASHVGTDRHADIVRGMLVRIGLSEDALLCPAAWPEDAQTRAAMIRDGATASPLRMNCSGKHAAMLAACIANGWPTETYVDPRHPLQAHLLEVSERLLGEKVTATVIDGCGAPVHATTLTGLARAVQRIGTASETSPFALHRTGGRLVAAAKANPWAVRGEGLGDSAAIAEFGVFSKFGAEGVHVMAAPDGTTVALKVLDGSSRAAIVVALTLLAHAGALDAGRVAQFADRTASLAVFGGGTPVGRIRASV